MRTVQYQLPNLDLLLDRQSRPDYKINPHESQLAEEFNSFLNKLSSIVSPFRRKEIGAVQLPLCAAAYAPDAGLHQLRVYLDYFIMLTFVEIMSDASNPQAGMFDLDFMKELVYVCAEDRPFDTSEHKDPLVELTARFVRQCFPPLPPFYRADVIQGTVLFFEAAAQEVHDRTNSTSFTVDSYLAHRRNVVAIKPTVALNRWISGIRLSQEILQTPAFMGLMESTTDLIALCNDLLSYKKEKEKGEDIHNVVSVTMVDPTVPVEPGNIQAALDFTAGKVLEAYTRFQSCKLDALAQIAPDDTETHAEVLRYASALLDMVDGNIVWHIDPTTERYHIFETPEERANWLVSICVKDR
ncbi:isoprenoid synthase domain-containing protein [Lentinula raphanica]|uniref:Terpene synthase n=1 Tax=Lentinula raphanica TaxID=153919 RepID=A0AA38U5Y5_9AGAR|nr:isoprenoid synthase domain-containing protein [Lentinula raphanica]KAJ3832977.1 isoprenoid synthase domain-containing protein [Lentinula raphanica]